MSSGYHKAGREARKVFVGTHNPRGTEDGGAKRRRSREIYRVTLAELVATTEGNVVSENGVQKKLVKRVRVICGESQRAPKHDGLVATDRMRRVEAVIRKLADVDECVFGVWKKHVVIVARVASRLTTQAQRPGPRDATIATGARGPGSLQRMVRRSRSIRRGGNANNPGDGCGA